MKISGINIPHKLKQHQEEQVIGRMQKQKMGAIGYGYQDMHIELYILIEQNMKQHIEQIIQK